MEYDNQIEKEIEEFSQKSFQEMDIDEERSNKIVIDNMGMSIDLEFPQNLSKSKNLDPSNYRPIYFRNYIPNDESFQFDKLPYFEKVPEIERQYEKKVKKGIKEFLNLEKNPLDIVPKKNNMDLKRHLAKKLEKLNKRTELAILELIKENIERQKKELEDGESSTNQNEEGKLVGEKLILATNMQMEMQNRELNREVSDEDDSDRDSFYDSGLN